MNARMLVNLTKNLVQRFASIKGLGRQDLWRPSKGVSGFAIGVRAEYLPPSSLGAVRLCHSGSNE